MTEGRGGARKPSTHPFNRLTLPGPPSTSGAMATTPDIAELSFEDALKRLEAIVQQLESGEVPLEKSIELYAEGDRLRAQCEERLKSAQARIEQIQVGPGGAAQGLKPFDAD
jgi:exodeoxyribonuclease VII small subunit